MNLLTQQERIEAAFNIISEGLIDGIISHKTARDILADSRFGFRHHSEIERFIQIATLRGAEIRLAEQCRMEQQQHEARYQAIEADYEYVEGVS